MEPLDKQSIKNVLEEVEKEAEKLAKKIKTSQIRNFYSKIIKIKQDFEKNANKWNEKIETQVLMLKPALAYAAGRQNSVEPFKEYIEAKIDQLMYSEDKDKGLEKFLMLIESFVAYHKFHGGN